MLDVDWLAAGVAVVICMLGWGDWLKEMTLLLVVGRCLAVEVSVVVSFGLALGFQFRLSLQDFHGLFCMLGVDEGEYCDVGERWGRRLPQVDQGLL